MTAPLPTHSPARDAPAVGASDDFTYDAFISYSSFRTPEEGSLFDRKVAERLHRDLEAYRTPRALLKRPPGDKPIPRRLRKVFRDRDEVQACGNLNDSLTESLRRSRFLIVICSPRARRSQWINQEIAIFRSFGRGEQILPLLIEGEPAEAFPEELFEPQRARDAAGAPGRRLTQPLAADIRTPSIAKSLRLLRQEKLRLLAPLLGCGYDDLRRREHERFVKRAAGAGAAMLAVLLTLAVLSLLLFFAQQSEKRNRQLALGAGSQLLPILGLDPNTPLGINDPLIRDHAVGRAIGYLEAIREDDPENLECLTILRALYGTQARLLKDRDRPDAAREAFRKSESLVVPIALSRLRARKQAETRGVKELTGESLSFPNDYDRQRLRALLSIMERLEGASSIKDAVDYVDTAAEYVSLLDTSTREGRGEARRVLQISLNRFHQAQTFGALTPEQEELVEAINKTLNKLPPDD